MNAFVKKLARYFTYPVGGIIFVYVYNRIVRDNGYPSDFQELSQIGFLMLFTMGLIIVLEFLIPYRSDWNKYQFSDLSDLGHFFFSSILPDSAARFCLLSLIGLSGDYIHIFKPGYLCSFPLWFQVIIGLVIYDLTYYWYHRLFHSSSLLWRIHRVHHSSEKLTFSKTFRFNALEIFFENVLLLGLLLISGINVAATSWVVSLTTFTLLLKHANIDIRIPPIFDWIFVSPATHRIHHSSNLQEYNKNYSGFTMIWDKIFGTYKNGSDYSGAETGIPGYKISNGFIGQVFDFLKK